jgi:2-methylcitrate dehydratase PrpD
VAIELTRRLGEFVAGLRYAHLPPESLSIIRTGFTDCIGVMIAGRAEPPAQLLKAALAPPAGEATLLFGEGTAPAPEAAWINGTAAHALDFDDVALSLGHPSAVLVPAILAEAQALGASGRQMMLAYAAGYETWAELSRRDQNAYHTKGWHPTGVFGAIGAAAACAALRGLSADQAAQAIGLGASQSAGIMANFGTMTKPFHAGRAAHSGVISARLASRGFTAALDALEHPQGFLSAVSPAGRLDVDTPVEAGRRWRLVELGLSVKKYPMCFGAHRALDGILDLLKEHPLDPARVARIGVRTSPLNRTVLRNHRPQTGLEAKFSMEFAMACAIVAGRARLSELADDFVRRTDVQSLIQRVRIDSDERVEPGSPNWAPDDQVTIETDDGRRMESRRVSSVRGDAEQPLQREELWEKFEDCVRAGGGVSARPLFESFMALDKLEHIGRLPGLAS